MQVTRTRDTGEIYLPHRNRAGQFVLADPRHGKIKHHKENQILADTLDQAVALIEGKGFSLRMKGQTTGQSNLISPDEIQIIR